MSLDEYVTVKEAAEILSVSDGRVRQYIMENRLPSQKVGNLRLIKRSDVESFEAKDSGRPKGKKK
jgi:excisionase family DNA binding protein